MLSWIHRELCFLASSAPLRSVRWSWGAKTTRAGPRSNVRLRSCGISDMPESRCTKCEDAKMLWAIMQPWRLQAGVAPACSRRGDAHTTNPVCLHSPLCKPQTESGLGLLFILTRGRPLSPRPNTLCSSRNHCRLHLRIWGTIWTLVVYSSSAGCRIARF